jgi:hypothetical protein
MRFGAAENSASLVAAERPPCAYRGSREILVCLLRRVSSKMGSGVRQFNWTACSEYGPKTSSRMEQRDSSDSFKLWDCVPMFNVASGKSRELYRAPTPFVVLRIAAYASWHAALWRLIIIPSWYGHSFAMYVYESILWQSGHSSIGA